eukprot:Skav228210  [mRNA]  locus=scaffold3219:123010:123498:+ [translate_table: standard]
MNWDNQWMQAEVTPKAKAAQARRGRVLAAATAGRLDHVATPARGIFHQENLAQIPLGPQPVVPAPPEVNPAVSGLEAVALPPQVAVAAAPGDTHDHAANEGHNGETCVICLDNMTGADQVSFLDCGHRLRTECIQRWMARSGRPFQEACPLTCWQSAVTVDE